MNIEMLEHHFEKMGARIKLEATPDPLGLLPRRRRPFVGAVLNNREQKNAEPLPTAIDIRNDARGEFFQVRFDDRRVDLNVAHADHKDRHLLLLVRSYEANRKEKFLCGHDERSWFVAAVPGDRGVSNVRTAKEALMPSQVRWSLDQMRVRFHDRYSRRNSAFVRQGEWFFIPHPEIKGNPGSVLKNEPLRRGRGKPHMCAFLCRSGGDLVHVANRPPLSLPPDELASMARGLTDEAFARLIARNPKAKHWGWQIMVRNPGVYVRGRVSHPDHDSIHLECWHQVVMNTESEAPAMRNVVFLD